MREANFPISAIHGDMPQKDWNRMMFFVYVGMLCSHSLVETLGGHLETYGSCGTTMKSSLKKAVKHKREDEHAEDLDVFRTEML